MSEEYISDVGKADGSVLDDALMQKAEAVARKGPEPFNGEMVDKLYELMARMRNGTLGNVDLRAIIERCTKEGVKLSEKAVRNYWLHLLETRKDYASGADRVWGRKAVGDILFQIHLDSPVGFALMCKDKPNAVAGLRATHGNVLTIEQMQGITGTRVYDDTKKVYPGGLLQIDWKRALIECSEGIARHHGIGYLAVQSGYAIRWTSKVWASQGKHLPLERALEIYDRTAERLGFKKAGGKWYKELK